MSAHEPEQNKTLSQRITGSGKWAFAIRAVAQGTGTLKTVILARILAPQDFGLFGVALLVLSAVTTLSQTGLDSAIIQKKGDVRSYLDTAWVVQVSRGLASALLLLIIGPYISLFFGEPKAGALVKVVGSVLFLKGLSNIGVVYFQKDLQFRKQFFYQFSGTATNFIVSVVLALITRSVWSLMWGLLAGQAASTVMSYVIHAYRPRFRFDGSKARQLLGFGGWVWGSGVLGFVALNGDDILLGKLLGVRSLGFYQTAYRLSQMPSSEITQVFSKVMFPAYSKLQNNTSRLQYTYSHHLQLISSLVMPLSGGILLLGKNLTRLVLGEQWMPLVSPLQLLAVAGLLRSIVFSGTPLFLAVSRPRIDFYMTLTRVGVMAITVYPLTKLAGMTGTCLCVLLGISLTIPIWLHYSAKILGLQPQALLRLLFSSLLGTLAFVVPGLLIVGNRTVGYLGLIGITFASVGIYVLVQYLFWKRYGEGTVATWKAVLGSL